jgi:hypothetical protein
MVRMAGSGRFDVFGRAARRNLTVLRVADNAE